MAGFVWDRLGSGSRDGSPQVLCHGLKLVVGFDYVDGPLAGARVSIRLDDPPVL